MARRGRPRDPNAKRRQTTRKGRKPNPQSNDPLKEHRVRLHGMAHISADHILDILAAKGWLTDHLDQHDDRATRNIILRDAGKSFAALYQKMHGRTTAGAIDLNSLGKGKDGTPTERDEFERDRYLRMQDILLDRGRHVFDAVVNVAVYGRAPADWRRPQGLQRLQSGLAALADVKPRRTRIQVFQEDEMLTA